MNTDNNSTRSAPSVNTLPDRIIAWCKAALFSVKTVISIIRALQHPPFDLPGFPAS